MGHSSNILGLKTGFSYKQKFFFISSSLVNYFIDFTLYYRFCYQYLYFLIRFKYYKIQQKSNFYFNHILFKHVHNKIIFKIYFKDYYYEKFFKIFHLIFFKSKIILKKKNIKNLNILYLDYIFIKKNIKNLKKIYLIIKKK